MEARTGPLCATGRAIYANVMQKALGYVCGLEELPMGELEALKEGGGRGKKETLQIPQPLCAVRFYELVVYGHAGPLSITC